MLNIMRSMQFFLLLTISLSVKVVKAGWVWDGVGFQSPDTLGYRTTAFLYMERMDRRPAVGFLYWDLNCEAQEGGFVPARTFLALGRELPSVTKCYKPHYRAFILTNPSDNEFLDRLFMSQMFVRVTLDNGTHPREFISEGYATAREEITKRYEHAPEKNQSYYKSYGEQCRVINTTPYGKVRIEVYRDGERLEITLPRKELAYTPSTASVIRKVMNPL